MVTTQRKSGLLVSVIFLLSLSASVSAHTGFNSSWRELSFEAKSMWATAVTGLYLSNLDSSEFGETVELLLLGSVAQSTERENILMNPDTGALLQRDRFTSGKNQRLKQYAYDESTITRVRREPGSDANLPPSQWPMSSEKTLNRPSLKDCPVLTSIPSLLILAGNVATAPAQTLTTCVHSDNNFYRVSMSAMGEEKIKVNYKLGGATKKVKGKMPALKIALTITRVGTIDGDMDFSLLGLSSPVIILVDKKSRLPLQVRGQAPRIGKTEINLIDATLADPEADQPG